MQLVVLTGFLGSGKTTALLSMARDLAGSGHKTAIIVNEIGDVGIDNQLLTQLGANVWELLGGCICCTLVADLGQTLLDIQARFAPDYVFIEPSGASNPGSIPDALKYNAELKNIPIHWIAIVDPTRIEELVEVLEPLMQSHLRQANIAVITKADEAPPEQMAMARRWITAERPEIPCIEADMMNEKRRAHVEELILCLN